MTVGNDYFWSGITGGATLSFNPTTDSLTFDDPALSAADLVFGSPDGTTSVFTWNGKTVTLSIAPYALATADIIFSDGSRFVVGDDSTGTALDDAANTVVGGMGDDYLVGAGGDDSVYGGAGDDVLAMVGADADGAYGSDTLDGGAGARDRLIYLSDEGFGVTVTLGDETTAGSATGGDGDPGSTLTLIGIEAVTGTDEADTLNANSNVEVNGLVTDILQRFEGGAGNDTITGATGDGRTTIAEYTGAASGVVVDLGAGTAQDGDGGTDTLVNIDGVVGSLHDDTLIGGGDGKDLSGGSFEAFEGLDGNDLIDGKGGGDRVVYDLSPSAVYVNLAAGTAQDGWGGTDTLVSIEQVRGSEFADTLTGGGNDEAFEGRGGDDTIDGGGGIDRVQYQRATEAVYVNLADGIGTALADTVAGGTIGVDSLVNVEYARGSDFGDYLVGGSGGGDGQEKFEGLAGNDTLDGGTPGIDVASYRGSVTGAIVNLGTSDVVNGADTVAGGTALDGYGGTDELIGINAAEGSAFDDTLVGGTGDEHFSGRRGADSIVGGGGVDSVYYEDSSARVVVNLETGSSLTVGTDTVLGGTALDGWGTTDTLSGIRNVFGSGLNDFIRGDGNDNLLDGGDGSDTILGGANGDTGADTMQGGWGDDWLRQSKGADVLDGGFGFDRLTFNNSTGSSSTGITYSGATGVAVNLGAGTSDYNTADGANPLGTLVDIESAWGTAGNDSLVGGSLARSRTGNNTFVEVFRGGGGNDTIDGANAAAGIGPRGVNDRVEFESITNTAPAAGAVVNLGSAAITGNYYGTGTITVAGGTARDGMSAGGGGTDTLIDIDWVRGTGNADTLIGGNVDHDDFERFEGLGGNDIIDGGSGNDEASYETATIGVNVNLATGAASVDGFGGNDTLTSIERVRGGGGNDTLTGSNSATAREFFIGGGGNDTIDGGDGTDFASWQTQSLLDGGMYGFIENGAGTVTVLNAGVDTLVNVEGLVGTSAGDTLQGGAGGQFFIGRGGDDSIEGGGGVDTVDYAGDPNAVNVNLGTGIATDGWGGLWELQGEDTLSSIENVTGSSFGDVITGNSSANLLDGGQGTDTLTGAGGDDTYLVNATADKVVESAAQGSDLVKASATYTLSANVENLTLTGATNINGTGNGAANSITGNTGKNSLSGGGGNDTLNGGGATDVKNDTLSGGGGNDSLVQTQGNDSIDGGADFDTLSFSGGSGGVNVDLSAGTSARGTYTASVDNVEQVIGTASKDTLTGGDAGHAPGVESGQSEIFQGLGGNDLITGAAGNGWITVADYSANTDTQAVNVVLGNGNNNGTASDGLGGTDTLTEIDQVRGGAGDDVLTGGSYATSVNGGFFEAFRGNAGNDTIDGGGSDTVLGAAANDRADYSNSPFGIVANIGTAAVSGDFFGTGTVTVAGGTARDGWDSMGGGTDTLIDIDTLRGSALNDTLVGGNAAFDNNERFEGGAGDDSIAGGSGSDEADYTNSTAAVVVDLGAGTAADGMGGTDTLVSIEMARGSGFDDTLIGGAGAFERLMGGLGDDHLDGGTLAAGDVNYAAFQLAGGAASAFVENGSGTASDGQGGTDTLVNINGLWGTNFDDTLTGGLGGQWFRGRGGDDILDGGAGIDTASYRGDAAGVTVNLATGTATDGWGGVHGMQGTDTLTGIENVEGSDFADDLTGSAAANLLDGGGGNDTLSGGGGSDTMIGGKGNDTHVVNAAGDVVTELASGGTDTVQSSVTETLDANVEKLVLTGAGNLNGTGNTLANTLTGNSGANVLNGGGGNDTLIGGGGNDTLIWDVLDGSIQGGGGGGDKLQVNGSGVTLDLTAVPNTRITDVEIVNITGSGANTLTLGLNDVLAISSTTDELRVDGNAGDTVHRGGGWLKGADQVIGANTYFTYTQGTATLLIDNDITVLV